MSVIITIKGNREYCREKRSVTLTQIPCQCPGYENGLRTAEKSACEHCGGQGYIEQEIFPYELNIANANFETLWSVLNLDPAAALLNPYRILKALRKTTLSLMVRGGVKQGNTSYCGISPEQASRYKVKLTELCEEASRREENIIWG
jgi:hypothetical protein